MNSVTLKIEGMHCSGCAATIQALIERIDGVRKAEVLFRESEARVLCDPQSVSEDQLIAAIRMGGFKAAIAP